jgi:hypothetical protein
MGRAFCPGFNEASQALRSCVEGAPDSLRAELPQLDYERGKVRADVRSGTCFVQGPRRKLHVNLCMNQSLHL